MKTSFINFESITTSYFLISYLIKTTIINNNNTNYNFYLLQSLCSTQGVGAMTTIQLVCLSLHQWLIIIYIYYYYYKPN